MSSSLDILGIGLLLLISNLMLCAILAPSFSFGNGSPGLRLRKTLRILILALVQIAAWAVMFHESGASPTPEAAGEEALRLFTFMGRSAAGLVGPWSILVPFVSLNGLLFLPISLISGFTPEVRVMTAETPAKPAETASTTEVQKPQAAVADYEPVQAPLEQEEIPPLLPVVENVVEKVVVQLPPAPKSVATPAPVAPVPVAPVPKPQAVVPPTPPKTAPAPAAATASKVAPAAPAPGASTPQGPRRGEPFRGSLPPIQLQPQAQPEMELPTFSPDRPMERIPPTPPPIRFT